MTNTFKTKLIELYNELVETRKRGTVEKEFQKMIRYGALGELAENYYLFLYRDFYRKSAYYGAVIFLNKPDPLGKPVTISGIEQNGKEQVRNVYVKAALYFLKGVYQNTMSVSGNSRGVFDMAKEKLNQYIQQVSPKIDQLESSDFNKWHQEIKYKEIPLKEIQKNLKSRGLEENLKKMGDMNGECVDVAENQRRSGELGLNLVKRHQNLSDEMIYYFQPLFIPIKENGNWGKPEMISEPGSKSLHYDWEESNEDLKNYVGFFNGIQHTSVNPLVKAQLLSQMYFQPMAEHVFSLPENRVYCQINNNKELLPFNKFKYEKLDIRFAPSLKRDSQYKFYLSFQDGNQNIYNARDQFEIILIGDHFYLLMTLPSGEIWFTAPAFNGTPKEVINHYKFFKFLSQHREFYCQELNHIITHLRSLESQYLSIHPEPLNKYELQFFPTPVLKIFLNDHQLEKPSRLEIEFDYQEKMKEFLHQHPDKEVCYYKPAESFENQCQQIIASDPFLEKRMDFNSKRGSTFYYYSFNDEDYFTWLIERGRKYLDKGFRIYSEKWKRYIGDAGGSIDIKVSSDIDWLEFIPQIRDSISGKSGDINFDDCDILNGVIVDKKGRLRLITPEEIEKLKKLFEFAERKANRFRIPLKNYVLINRLFEDRMDEISTLPQVKEAQNMEKCLREFERIPDYPISDNFRGDLRRYQKEGFKWLHFLRDYQFSGCLGDDMGLGKTVQTLALLQTLKEKKQLSTSLLVVPVSAIPNWESEIKKFTKGISYYRHLGISRDKNFENWQDYDLIITSYATLRNDIEWLKAYEFDYIILDESQNIKNYSSQISKAVKILKSRSRLALSGTPIENNSLELWSLFDFLMPGYLGTYQWFNRQLGQGIEKEQNPEKIQLLKKMIYPFILRRKKQDVEIQLPEKVEVASKLQMDGDQLDLYGEVARFYREELSKEIDKKGVQGSSIKILEGMLRLRQICLFPQLIDEKYAHLNSVKFDHFKELLEDILAENHKVLVFSQFVKALKKIQTYCDERDFSYSYIDGSVAVSKREEMINRFQKDEENRIFLLSLKAGGVALNLTAADYVIIFDPWWNPAVEAQAIDRSHRIGQTKNVMVYRLVVKDSIEEKILELQERKKNLVEKLIVSDSKVFKDLKKEDVLELFK